MTDDVEVDWVSSELLLRSSIALVGLPENRLSYLLREAKFTVFRLSTQLCKKKKKRFFKKAQFSKKKEKVFVTKKWFFWSKWASFQCQKKVFLLHAHLNKNS